MIIVPHVVAYGHVLRAFSRRLHDSTGCMCVLGQLECVSAPCSAVRHHVAAGLVTPKRSAVVKVFARDCSIQHNVVNINTSASENRLLFPSRGTEEGLTCFWVGTQPHQSAWLPHSLATHVAAQ